jgi:phage-related baseplate assembly protein
MAGTYTAVDLSQLPKPTVVETLDFETIFASMLADLVGRDPTFTALVESDPAYKILEVCAFRELNIRQRVNDAAVSVMLAYAEKEDLDNIGANYDVPRLTITPADNTTIPPTEAVMESDTDYRARIQLSPEGYSCAGPIGAYTFFALSASGDVLDVSVTTPVGGTVLVTVLSRTGDGTAPPATLAAVAAALTPDTTRPLCDTVVVRGAAIVGFDVIASLQIFPGIDQTLVLANAIAAGQAYVTACHKMGRTVSLGKLEGALGVAGVSDVILSAPGLTATLTTTDLQAPYCRSLTVTIGGIGD